MITIGFINNNGGNGRASQVYHLAWMFSERGIPVVAMDLDPQAILTSMFLDEDQLEELWPRGKRPGTILGCIDPILRGLGDYRQPRIVDVGDTIGLIPGDAGLSGFENEFSGIWRRCDSSDEFALGATTAFYRIARDAAEAKGAELVLIDAGPSLDAITRTALIASDKVVVPMASDLFAIEGLRTLGPKLREWRDAWKQARGKCPDGVLPLPAGEMTPLGYIVTQDGRRTDRPTSAYRRWMDRIPFEYAESVGSPADSCLASIRSYRGLMPLAMEARKPMFHLKPADGALGAHAYAVKDCYSEFHDLSQRIAERAGYAPIR